MQSRPRYKVLASTPDKLLEAAGWISLALLWIITIVYYPRLPAIIPVHFNLQGEVDNFGAKSTLFILPAIGTIVLIGLSILNNYPHLFNYPTTINEQTAPAQYRNAVRMMRVVKFSVSNIFLVILLHTISAATGTNQAWASPWLFYLALLLLLLPVIYFVVKGLNIKAN